MTFKNAKIKITYALIAVSILFYSQVTYASIKDLQNHRDPYYNMQYYLRNFDYEDFSKYGLNYRNQLVIAVIDSGIDFGHEDLSSKIIDEGYNFIDYNSNPEDNTGHGTTVTGVIAAEANNFKGIKGVAGNANIKILPIKALNNNDTYFTEDIVKSINYAIEKEVDIINLSIAQKSYSEEENKAIQRALNKGITIVASSGNDGNGEYMYPASYDGVISVGAVNEENIKSSFSNSNDKVDIVAPGEKILTTDLKNTYSIVKGTSYATAYVSGIVGLMKAIKPELSPGEIKEILQNTADDKGDLGYDRHYGHGLINPYKALEGTANSTSGIIPLQGAEFNKRDISIYSGEISEIIEYKVYPKEANHINLQLKADNNDIIRVNQRGQIIGIEEGTTLLKLINSKDRILDTMEVRVLKRSEELEVKEAVNLDKEWEIKFNKEIQREIDHQAIKVIDSSGERLETNLCLSQDQKTLRVKPYEDYKENKRYTLYISDKIKAETGENLKHSIRMTFITKPKKDIGTKLLAKTESTSEISLYWDPVLNAKYYIYWSDEFDGVYTPFKNEDGSRRSFMWFPETCLRNIRIPAGTTRYYKIKTIVGNEESSFSNIAYETTELNHDERVIKYIKEGYHNKYDHITIKNAFESYFTLSKWGYYSHRNNQHLVEYKGYHSDKGVATEIKISFLVNEDINDYKIDSIEKDRKRISKEDEERLIRKIFFD